MNRRNFVAAFKTFSKKALGFELAGLVLFAALFASCENMGGDAGCDSAALLAQMAAQGSSNSWGTNSAGLKMGRVTGRICDLRDGNASASAGAVSRSVVPDESLVQTSVASYTVKAWGTNSAGTVVPESAPIEGTVDFSAKTFSIGLEYGSWTLRADGYDGAGGTGNIVLTQTTSEPLVLNDENPVASLSFALDYPKIAGKTGALALALKFDTSLNIGQITYSLKKNSSSEPADTGSKFAPSSGVLNFDSTLNTKFGALEPGDYQLEVDFRTSGGAIIVRLDQTVQIYSNITTTKIDGVAPYISAGAVNITADVVKKYQQSVVYVGGTGLNTGTEASDSNNGTQFDPVATIKRALAIVDASALTSADIPDGFKIYIQADTALDQNAAIASGKKISFIGTNSSAPVKIDGGGSFAIISLGTFAASNIQFNKLKGFDIGSGSTTLNNCKITNGTARVDPAMIYASTGGGGGGICVKGPAKAVLTDCVITGCSAESGGAVYARDDTESGLAEVELVRCVIGEERISCASESSCSNKAGGGGGIYINRYGKATLTNTKILGNCAESGCGGAIFCNAGTLVIKGGQINWNRSKQGGGGVYVAGFGGANGNAVIDDCVIGASSASAAATGFSDCANACETGGGGIHIGSYGTLTSANGFTVRKNYSAKASSSDGNGGGIYTQEELTLAGCDISYNGAAANGGGVCADGASAILRLQGGTISSNSADEDGGGVYVSGGATMLMSGDAVIGDKNAPSYATEHAYSNSATNGGGIAVDNASAYIGYTAAASPQDAFEGGIYYNYASAAGGGVYMSDDSASKLYLYKGNVDKNCAIYFGGAAHCGNAGELKISKTVIGSNITAYYGGGISIGDGNPSTAQVTIEDALIQENLALKVADSAQGGAIRAASFDSFALKGGVSIPAGVDGATGAGKNDVWLANGETITIGSTLSAATTPMATITPETYASGTAVLSDAGTGTLVQSEMSKFAVLSQSEDDDWTIGYNDSTKKGVLSSAVIYVSGGSDGSDDDTVATGSSAKPYKTVAHALGKVTAPNCSIIIKENTAETEHLEITAAMAGLKIKSAGATAKTITGASGKEVKIYAPTTTLENIALSAWDCVDVYDDVTGVKFNNVTVSDGHNGAAGGGIWIAAGADVEAETLTVKDCYVDSNGSGGAICVANGAKFSAKNLVIQDCHADGANANGGGVYNAGTLLLNKAQITGCAAGKKGGGIFNANNATLILDGVCDIPSGIYLTGGATSGMTAAKPLYIKGSGFALASGADKIPLEPDIRTGTEEFQENSAVIKGWDPEDGSAAYEVTEAQVNCFVTAGTALGLEYDGEATPPCGKLVDKSIAGGVTVSLGGNISFEIATPTASGEKARFNVIDNSSGTPTYVTPTSAQIKILQYGTPVYSANAQEVAATYLPEGEYELYCKAVIGGVTYDTTLPFGAGGKYTPLTLEAATAGAVVTFDNKAAGDVTYRVNGGTAQTIASGASEAITLNAVGDKVQFFGDNTTYGASGGSYNCSNISCTEECYVYGNIMSLVKSDDFASEDSLMGNYTFACLFYDNAKIKNKTGCALLLPATTLTTSCYSAMFYGCSLITVAPDLPATTLKNSCYHAMFQSCKNLATASALPAETLVTDCYKTMFQGCSNLTTAPVLPATTLADSCYESMFLDCTSLTTAPALPATTLADGCYRSMFYRCTSLATAPALPATTLTPWCYYSMFYRCTSLATAPELPATTLASYCYNSMFRYCSSLTTAPELPATTLAGYCYTLMFDECTSLTTAPLLPAPILVDTCYYGMFEECSNLNSVTCLATDISAEGCTTDWLDGVATTGTFTKAAAMTGWTVDSTSGIPTGWTVKSAGSAVPAGFVSVPGGTYNGSDTLTPTSSVFISGRTLAIGNLWVCDHEVTQAEYQAVMGNNPSNFTGSDDLPVEKVSWYDAIAYCNKRSAKEGLGCVYTISGISDWKNFDCTTIPTTDNATWNAATCNLNANGYRLPTEAEWEYIARNKNQDSYTYSGSNTIDYVAWYKTNSSSKTHEVKTTTKGNGLGIYDMSGNVLEWCWDYYNTIDTSTSATGPSSASAGSRRVYRGGGWNDDTSYCSVAYRRYRGPYNRDNDVGFRVVRNAP